MFSKLPRRARRAPRTGTVVSFRKGDRTLWAARILLKNGSRKQLRCPVGFTREQAEKKAAEWQAKEDATHGIFLGKQREAGIPVDGEHADKWFARMLPIRAAALHTKDAPELAARWRVWISPAIGSKPLAAVTRDDLLGIRDSLDAASASGRLQPKTAINVWSCVKTAFRVACSTKGWAKALRVLDRDPTVDIEAVDDGPSRKRQWIYPVEFDALMACVDVPEERRYLYACAAMTGLRPEELVELRWKDVDFVAGVIRVSRALDWKSKEIGLPKTAAAIRDVPIEPSLRPALKARAGEPEGFVVPRFSDDKAAKQFREDLATAGVLSQRLSQKTRTHLPADFRCLRDSNATWARLRRDPPELIMARLGHEDLKTTFKYTKVAESVGVDVGTPFGPLPFAPGPGSVTSSVTPSKPAGKKQRRGWDSNALYTDTSCMVSHASVDSEAASDQFRTSENPADAEITPRVTLTAEDALALALERASEAGQWSVVAMLAKELEARRLAGSNVVALDAKKGGAK